MAKVYLEEMHELGIDFWGVQTDNGSVFNHF